MGPSRDVQTCASAAHHGHHEVLNWLRAQNPPAPFGPEVCAAAAAGGHLEVLQWLRSQDPP